MGPIVIFIIKNQLNFLSNNFEFMNILEKNDEGNFKLV